MVYSYNYKKNNETSNGLLLTSYSVKHIDFIVIILIIGVGFKVAAHA